MEGIEELNDFIIIDKSAASEYFDEVIGHVEDIIISEEFISLHTRFLEAYWHCFEDKEENKLEYMNIFQQYTNTFETYFQTELRRRMTNFNMQRFTEHLNKNEDYHDAWQCGEIYELLQSFSNFQIFKDLMINYRSKKEGYLHHMDFNILTTKKL